MEWWIVADMYVVVDDAVSIATVCCSWQWWCFAYVGYCRWFNVFLFEVIDCCMSESGDVIIDELDTLSLLDISSFQWFIDAAAYQLTCCSLSNGSRSTKWLMTPRWRPTSTKCVLCGCVHGRRRNFICTASLSPGSSCSVRWYRLPKTLQLQCLWGGKVLMWWLIKVKWSGSPF